MSSGVLCAQVQQSTPELDGYVTRTGTPADFDVNGVHVICRYTRDGYKKYTMEPDQLCTPHVYGEHLRLFGHHDKKAGVLYPSRIEVPDHPLGSSLSGFAVLDAVLAPDMLRLDGYAVQLVPSTRVLRQAPLTAGDPPEPGQWVRYSGKREAGGVIRASSVEFFAPNVTSSEQKLREKAEFDPAGVAESDRQGTMSRLFVGVNYKRVPASHDAALQERVASLGKRLIPVMQKRLPAGDPNKIDFRFQVVESNWKDAITMPSGIILVPEPLAAALPDDQLAAVLADNIVTALEKQGYRSVPGNQARSAANLAGLAGGLLVPGLGIVTSVGTGISAYEDVKHAEEQSGRNALVLLHDAGFDIQQAPLAWWRASTYKPDFLRTRVPYRAAYLFEVLATNWTSDSPLNRPTVVAGSKP